MNKKQLSKNISGGSFVSSLFMVLPYVFSYIITGYLFIVAALALSGGKGDLSSALAFLNDNENIYAGLLNLFYYVLIFMPFLIYLGIRKKTLSDVISFRNPRPSHIFYSVTITFTVATVVGFAVNLITALLEKIGFAPAWPGMEMPSSAAGVIIYGIQLFIIPAIVEEICFRGVILGESKNISPSFAIIFSAILFSLMHGTVQQIPNAFVLGLLMGYFVIKFGSIWIGVIIHFINNFVVFISEFLQKFGSQTASTVFSISFEIIMIAFGICAIIYYTIRHDIKIHTDRDGVPLKEALGLMLRNPWFYIFIGVAAVKTVASYFGF